MKEKREKYQSSSIYDDEGICLKKDLCRYKHNCFFTKHIRKHDKNKFCLFHTIIISLPLSGAALLTILHPSNHDTPTLLNASLPIYLPPTPLPSSLTLSFSYTLFSFSYTLKICNFFANAILTQSGCALLHCKLFTSASALYANIGSSTLRRDICVKSHINA